ncbi:MAG: transglutaminaseTgpA domain-containing protein [Brachybacterium tyrofermentans]
MTTATSRFAAPSEPAAPLGPAAPSEPAPSPPRTYFASVRNSRRAIDIALLGTLFLLALAGFQPAYGGVDYLFTGTMATVLGTMIALIGARFRWGPLRIAALLVLVYALFGSLLAAPVRALWGVLPTRGSLLELLAAPVVTWKSALTVVPPVGTAQGVLGVVWISVLLLTVLGTSVALRSRRYLIAWFFPLALLLLSIAFGTTETFLPVVRGVLFAVLSVGWLTWRYESERLDGARSAITSDVALPGFRSNPVPRRRMIGGALVMLLAGSVAVGAHSLLDPPEGTGRFAVRDRITPPFDPREYVSPLSEFRGYLKDQREAELFSITGVAPGEYVRLAAMDLYDLQAYNVAGNVEKDSASGAFLRVADGVDLHRPTDEQRTSTVRISDYTGVWLPTVGDRTDRIELDGLSSSRAGATAESLFLNDRSQTAVNASGVRTGDVYTLRYEPYREPTIQQQNTATFAEVRLPQNADIDVMTSLAAEWAGDSESDYERFLDLSRSITADATFSHGIDDGEAASFSGHGASRLLAMLEPVGFDEAPAAQPVGRIGDQEQFAALTAVMARSIGMPARVVMGFEVPPGAGETASITGEDVTAWVEVKFEDLGWVRFASAPEEDETPTGRTPGKVDGTLPQVAHPRPSPADPTPGATSGDSEGDELATDESVPWTGYVAYPLIPATPVLALVVVVLVAKSVRRGRRRTRGSLAARIDGGWQEILDLLTDLGHPPDPMRTRAETAELLERHLPAMGALALAREADRAVFGPDDQPDSTAEEYWWRVRGSRRILTDSVPWHRRLRAAISPRSLCIRSRRRTQEGRRARTTAPDPERAARGSEALRRRHSSIRDSTSRPPTTRAPASRASKRPPTKGRS